MAYNLRDNLLENNIEAYVDDSEKSPGFKFAEAEVQGIPVRIELGERDLKENKIVFARRDTREKIEKQSDIDIVSFVKELLDTIQKDMYNRALKRREEKTYVCHNLDEVKDIMENHPGFVKAMWCGDEECELKMKEIRGTKSRCILDEEAVDDKCIVCGKEAKELVESAPKVIKEAAAKEEAEDIKKKFEEVGATITLK
jgi:prolyl-tRNA synthetase